MVVPLLIGGVGLITLPGLLRGRGRRLHPREYTRACAVSLALGSIVVTLALALMAAPAVLTSVGVHACPFACEPVLGPAAPHGAAAGWAAAAAAIGLPVVAAVTAIRARRSLSACRAAPGLGNHSRFRGYDVVVLPTEDPVAAAVGTSPAQVVLSAGTVQALSGPQLDAVLRHEAAHIDLGHHRYLFLAAALDRSFAWVPGGRASTRCLRTGLERWADEEAAGSDADARAGVRSALLGVARVLVGPATAAFSAAETLEERLIALQAPPPQPSLLRRVAVYGPWGTLATGVMVTFGFWAAQLGGVLGVAVRCPV